MSQMKLKTFWKTLRESHLTCHKLSVTQRNLWQLVTSLVALSPSLLIWFVFLVNMCIVLPYLFFVFRFLCFSMFVSEFLCFSLLMFSFCGCFFSSFFFQNECKGNQIKKESKYQKNTQKKSCERSQMLSEVGFYIDLVCSLSFLN